MEVEYVMLKRAENKKSRIFNQRSIPRLGGFLDALYGSLPMLSAANFVSILIVLYTDIRPYLIENVPWINIWIFGSIIATLVLILMLFVYKFILPSIWTFRSKLMFSQENKVIGKLDAIEKRLDRIEKMNEKKKK